MNEEIELIPVDTSEKIRLTSVPYMMLRTNGSSYINAKAASLLDLKHGDTIRFYHNADQSKWFISNHQEQGANTQKSQGLFKFCDTKTVRKIFNSYNINTKKSMFPISSSIELISGIKVLFIIPKPFNQD